MGMEIHLETETKDICFPCDSTLFLTCVSQEEVCVCQVWSILSTIAKTEPLFSCFSFMSLFDSFARRKDHMFDRLKSVTQKITFLFPPITDLDMRINNACAPLEHKGDV